MRHLPRACVLAALLAVGPQSCQPTLRAAVPEAPPLPGPSHPRSGRTRSVILITLDGVRPLEVFGGVDPALAGDEPVVPAAQLVPNLYRLAVSDGVAIGRADLGAPLLVSARNHVSLPGYLEILAGRPPSECEDNACAPRLDGTMLDDFRAASDGHATVAAFTSWEVLSRVLPPRSGEAISAGRDPGAARAAIAFDGYAERLLEEGERADPYPGQGEYRPDRRTTRVALRHLAARAPRFLYVGLGDTDEHAHRGDYAGYVGALREADRFVGEVIETLSMIPGGADTTVVITTDHGRSAGFRDHGSEAESAAVWLIAAGGAVPARGIVGLRAPRYLADLRATVSAWAGLPVARGTPILELLP